MEEVKETINWNCPFCLTDNQTDSAGVHLCTNCRGNWEVSSDGKALPFKKTETSEEKSENTPEQVLTIFANIILGIGIIAGIILFFVGISAFGETRDYWGRIEKTTGWLQLGLSACVVVMSAIYWAFIRVFVNISNSLTEINQKMKCE